MNIVFIDDATDNLKLFEIYTKGLKHSFHMFSSPLEGLDYLLSNEVDTCFLDIRMPEVDGYEVLKRYFEGRPVEERAKVFALTGMADSEEIQKINNSGFEGALTKPILRSKLIDAIESSS